MDLLLKAKHFKDTDYNDNHKCAISKAAKEQFKARFVSEGVNTLRVDSNNYLHDDYYLGDHFNVDKIEAEKHKFDETIIRTITLTKI